MLHAKEVHTYGNCIPLACGHAMHVCQAKEIHVATTNYDVRKHDCVFVGTT